MFIYLLLISLFLAFVVSFIVSRVFNKPIKSILGSIVECDMVSSWSRYINFAMLVVGVSSGVQIDSLERYITPHRFDKDAKIITLNPERLILELYETIIQTLQGISCALLAFFFFSFMAYLVIRIFWFRKTAANSTSS